jgi:predicted dehydrogenase
MAENSTPIRVGLIGYGFAGKTFHAPLIGAIPGLSLVAVCSRDPAKVLADLPQVEVLADPMELATSRNIDLVVIAAPNDSHVALARAALNAHKHVVVDKPFTLNSCRCARPRHACRSTAATAIGVPQSPLGQRFSQCSQAIADGVIGSVAHFESHFDRFRPEVRARWREGRGPGSGVWFDLGPHLVDQAIQLFGVPDRVLASFSLQRVGAPVR